MTYGVDVIDLSEHYVVLGSGLSAVATVHGIIDARKDDNRKIFIVDAGITKNTVVGIDHSTEEVNITSPKFKVYGNRYVYHYFKSLINLTESGFRGVGSLAKGGLSNIWGAGIHPYNAKELSTFPYSYREIQAIYSKIYKLLTKTDSDLVELSGDSEGASNFSLAEPLLAINAGCGSDRSCHLDSCGDGCIHCNKNVFKSGDHLEELVKSKKVEYMGGLLINSIESYKNQYIVNCSEISTGKNIRIKTTCIYSCLGAISTTKIALGLAKSEAKTPLLSTPGGVFFMYSFNDFHKVSNGILSCKSFKGSVCEIDFNGNIFPVSRNLVMSYFGDRIGRVLFFFFGRLFFSRLFAANIFFSSELSDSSVRNCNEGVMITGKNSLLLMPVFKKAMTFLRKKLLSRGLFVLPVGKKLLQPGEDIHYGGSIPMKEKPQINQCNLKGELHGFRRFYVADAASMPFLASKGHSFNSMVNSYYIARESLGTAEL